MKNTISTPYKAMLEEKRNSNVKASVKSNKTEIISMEEIELTLKLEIEQEKINTFKAKIDYDKYIFEELTIENFSVCNSWTNLKYNEKTQEFIIINLKDVKSEEIVKIRLKVRNNIENVKSTTIKITNMQTANWETKQEINIITTNGKQEEKLEIPIKKQSNIENYENNKISPKKPTEDNIAPSILPKTGHNHTIFIVIIIAIAILIINRFFKIRNVNHKLNKILSILFVTMLVGTSLGSSIVKAEDFKLGDISKDGKITITDVEMLENHLIGLNKIVDDNSINIADINRDGKLSIIDLSLLIRQMQEKLPIEDDKEEEKPPVEDDKEEEKPPVEDDKEEEKPPVEDDKEEEKPSIEANKKTAQQAIEEMKVGWNLGNTLDSCNYKKEYLKQDKAVARYETLWGNPQTTKQMIDEIKKAGFGSIRVPVTYYDHIDADGIVDEKWFARVKEVVEYVLANDMYCIMDVHHDSGLWEGGSWIVADADKYEENAKKIEKLWTQIANQFKDYDYKLVFEGMNEIVDKNKTYDWQKGYYHTMNVYKLNQVFVNTVRKTGGKNKDRFLAVTTFGGLTDEQKLSTFKMPKDEAKDKIILALHDYSKTETNIDKMLSRIKKYCTDKNIPVILDEFGTKSSEGDIEKRAQIASYYVSHAKKLGVTCFWWDDGGSYQIFRRTDLKWVFPQIRDALKSNSTL